MHTTTPATLNDKNKSSINFYALHGRIPRFLAGMQPKNSIESKRKK